MIFTVKSYSENKNSSCNSLIIYDIIRIYENGLSLQSIIHNKIKV